jgi:CRP-like cAMP-binding protein
VVLMGLDPAGVVEPLPLVVLRTGQAPVRQGEPFPGVWRVQAGLLCASIVHDDGRELWLDVMGPGDVVGGRPGWPAPWTIRALRPSRLTATGFGIEDDLLAERTARLTSTIADLAWLDVVARVERRLRDLAGRFGEPVPGGIALPFRLRHDDLAALAATTRESTSRAIRDLTSAGVVGRAGRGRYVISAPLRRA